MTPVFVIEIDPYEIEPGIFLEDSGIIGVYSSLIECYNCIEREGSYQPYLKYIVREYILDDPDNEGQQQIHGPYTQQGWVEYMAWWSRQVE